MSIHIGNLFYKIEPEGLDGAFSESENIEKIYLFGDRKKVSVAGFAFVGMKSEADENKANFRKNQRNASGGRNNRF